MTDKELRDAIQNILRRDRGTFSTLGDYLRSLESDINEIFDLIKQAGYLSPEEVDIQEKKFIESEKILNREAAFDEQRLRDEVKYWKDKSYRLGG